jgi:hypothetical protein
MVLPYSIQAQEPFNGRELLGRLGRKAKGEKKKEGKKFFHDLE